MDNTTLTVPLIIGKKSNPWVLVGNIVIITITNGITHIEKFFHELKTGSCNLKTINEIIKTEINGRRYITTYSVIEEQYFS